MGFPRKLLGEGEEIVRDLRPHWKEVLVPAILFVATVGVSSYLAAIVTEGDLQPWLRGGIAVLALIVIGRFAAYPFLRWLTTEYTITNRRIITRVGLLTRLGRDMPLGRINDVHFEHSSVLERMLGCGTLVIESAGERGQLVLADVPEVEVVQREVYRLYEEDDYRRRARFLPNEFAHERPEPDHDRDRR
jgi:uncharacterized membrane protein YdbT with pleckstrin-like domain